MANKDIRPGVLRLVRASVILVVVLGVTIFLFQGLPAADLDDWDKIILARETPWSRFASSFLTPWSQSQHWVGQTDRYDEVRYKRIVLPMLLKFSQGFFGTDFFAMYFLTKGIFFAGTVALMFLLLSQAVPWFFALAGTLCFLFVPAHYSHALWIADSATVSYAFLFLGIFLLRAVHKNITGGGSRFRFACLLAGIFATGWTGIRAKELALVLPLVVFLFSLLNFKQWKTAPGRYALLNLVMAFVAFQIVPVTRLALGSMPGLQFKWETIGRLLFLNYECGYDNETRSAFFSWEHVFPVSVARTLGFFLLWSIVLAFILLLWRVIRRDKTAQPFWKNEMTRIAGLWLLVEVPFLGMFQPDPRYFSGTLAPVLILTARLFYCALRGARRPVFWGLLTTLFFAAGFNLYENVQNALSVRLMIGKK